MNGLSAEQVAELRADLATLHQELEALLTMADDGARPIELEQPIGRLSRMDAMQQREMAMANHAAHQRRLSLVDEAVEAMEDGSYGLCANCDRPIAFSRLKALPETISCLPCQERLE